MWDQVKTPEDRFSHNEAQIQSTDGNVGDKFTIGTSTGWISAVDLEFAALNTYSLEITAKDRNGGAGFQSATTTVQVGVATS